ncbi:hypothetical protein [Dokdonia sp.]|uniref:hypothetical protein n=1 Tax=Dokdonia sp. TaxID=2024995 RepID=UPI003264E868
MIARSSLYFANVSYLKKIIKGCLQLVIISCITLLLFEVVYRYGVIDFYKAEIEALNSKNTIESDSIDYLVFGDSFSTPTNNYVDRLQKKHPEISFLNLGISGTGIKQVNTFARKKIKKYNPKHIIYQVYIGNDLLDVKHLSNWKDLSVTRNVYWGITNYISSGVYINQRLKGFSSNKIDTRALKKEVFSVPLYTKRQRMLFKADSDYLYNTITLQDDFMDRYDSWKKAMTSFLEIVPSDVTVSVVFVPHCAQVNNQYYTNMLELGAQFKNKENTQENNYVFYAKAVKDFQAFTHVSFYNPIKYLKQKDAPLNRLYYNNDPHFNDQGQKAIYEFLDEVIFDK